MTVKARRSHIFPKAIDGHYVEPAWCSERLFAIESFGAQGALVLDPAAGWGNVARAASAAGYTAMASDIVDRLDRRGLEDVRFHICNFLEESPVRSAWSIACNPPFDHIKEFCERGLEIATYKVAMIVPLRRLPAARWLESLPLESIYLLTPRPSMPPGTWIEAGNIPSGGSQDFCWLVFNKRAGAVAPRLRWLSRLNGARRESTSAGVVLPPVTTRERCWTPPPTFSRHTPPQADDTWRTVMALGKRKDGGNFLPIIKYDARVGTFYLQDRVNSGGAWQTEQRDVTENFQAAFDLENLQRGWIRFPKGAAPEVTLVPAGDDPGEPPTDDHKEGVRVVLKMASHLGGDVRELMSTARGLWNAIDTLHDQYLASAAEHAGKVPVITLDDVREVKTAGGATFVPTFKIADWIPRPPGLAGAVQARPVEAQLAMPLAQPRPRRATVRSVPAAASADIEDEIPF